MRFKAPMREMVLKDDFLAGQFSLERAARADHAARYQRLQPARDQRHPRTTSGTTSRPSRPSSCRRPGRSRSDTPSPGRSPTIGCRPAAAVHPSASLISLWSTAPFLQNNTVGPFEWSPSVDARLRSFDASIGSCSGRSFGRRTPLFRAMDGPGLGVIDRLTVDSYSRCRRTTSRPTPGHPLGPARRLFSFFTGGDYSVQDWALSQGHADRFADQHRSARFGRLADEAQKVHQQRLLSLLPARDRGGESRERICASSFRRWSTTCSRSASARTSSSTRGTTSVRAISPKNPA